MKNILHEVRADAVIERVKTDNVLNPLLWICGITEIVAVPAAFFSNDGAQIFFCSLAAFPVGAALIAYFIWMFRDPNRLQSEDYQIKQQIIRQGSKEHDFAPILLTQAIIPQSK